MLVIELFQLSCSKLIMTEPAKKPDLGLLEEDDEFEEFPAEGILNYSIVSVKSFSEIARVKW